MSLYDQEDHELFAAGPTLTLLRLGGPAQDRRGATASE